MTVVLVMILVVNFLGARAYGETEFWLSSMKIIAIVGLIILGIVLMAGGGPNKDPIGFRYWVSPGGSRCYPQSNFDCATYSR
jgi:amino acid transporter